MFRVYANQEASTINYDNRMCLKMERRADVNKASGDALRLSNQDIDNSEIAHQCIKSIEKYQKATLWANNLSDEVLSNGKRAIRSHSNSAICKILTANNAEIINANEAKFVDTCHASDGLSYISLEYDDNDVSDNTIETLSMIASKAKSHLDSRRGIQSVSSDIMSGMTVSDMMNKFVSR